MARRLDLVWYCGRLRPAGHIWCARLRYQVTKMGTKNRLCTPCMVGQKKNLVIGWYSYQGVPVMLLSAQLQIIWHSTYHQGNCLPCQLVSASHLWMPQSQLIHQPQKLCKGKPFKLMACLNHDLQQQEIMSQKAPRNPSARIFHHSVHRSTHPKTENRSIQSYGHTQKHQKCWLCGPKCPEIVSSVYRDASSLMVVTCINDIPLRTHQYVQCGCPLRLTIA